FHRHARKPSAGFRDDLGGVAGRDGRFDDDDTVILPHERRVPGPDDLYDARRDISCASTGRIHADPARATDAERQRIGGWCRGSSGEQVRVGHGVHPYEAVTHRLLEPSVALVVDLVWIPEAGMLDTPVGVANALRDVAPRVPENASGVCPFDLGHPEHAALGLEEESHGRVADMKRDNLVIHEPKRRIA